MKKSEILHYLQKELDAGKDYNFLNLDMREKKPRLFRAWWIEKEEKYGIRD